MKPMSRARRARSADPDDRHDRHEPTAQGPIRASTFSVAVPCRYATDTRALGAHYSAAAYLVVSKMAGGVWYTVTCSGFNDTAYYGQHLSLTFSAAGAVQRPDDGPGAAVTQERMQDRVQDRGDALWVCLSNISGPLARLDEAVPYFDARFGGMVIEAVASVRKAPA